MAKINVNISQVKSLNKDLIKITSKLGDIERDFVSVHNQVDSRIKHRRSIDSRLDKVIMIFNESEKQLKALHNFIESSLNLYDKAEKKIKNSKPEELESIWDKITESFKTTSDVIKGFVEGLSDSVVSTVEGLWNMIAHPIQTGKGIIYVIEHPIKTGEGIWNAISESWKNDVINGGAESRSKWVGRAVGEVALAIVGTKGVDKAVKLVKGTKVVQEAAGGVKIINKATAEAIANAKFTKTILQGTRGFMEDMASSLDDVGLSASRFNELRPVSADTLSAADRTAMRALRDSIPMPTNETIMQKVIPQEYIMKYISGEYKGVGGYVAKAQDVKQLTNYEDIYNSLRLDYKGAAFKSATDECVGVIRFRTPQASEMKIPYSKAMDDTSIFADKPPYTGNGFTAATNGQAIPEYYCDGQRLSLEEGKSQYLSLEDGAELYTVTKDGTETLAAVYDSYFGRFVDILK